MKIKITDPSGRSAYAELTEGHFTDAMRTTIYIQQRYGIKVSDQSVHYRGYKDLNNYLCRKRLTQSVELTQPTKQTELPKKKSRGFRM